MKNNTPLSIRRLVFTLIVLQIGFLVLVGKLFTIQYPGLNDEFLSRKDWRTRGEQDVKRGKILDRHQSVLGISQDTLSVSVDPKTFNRKSNAYSVATELAPILEESKSDVLEKLKRKQNEQYVEFVWLKKDIDYEKYDSLRSITRQHRGLKISVEPRRVYPKKALASQVIGYLNDEKRGEGVELLYDKYLGNLYHSGIVNASALTPVSTQTQSMTNPLNNNGCNVVLTLDEYIQRIAEKELAQGCKDWNAPRGTAIVLAVETSEILAMASHPSYDINDQTNANEEAKRNLGIWYVFEPGSIFKIVASSAVLNENKMTSESTVFCEYGRFRLPNRRVVKDVSAKGWLSLTEVIQKSSNIGMIKIVQALGVDSFQTYINKFGFGKKTGVDLPYEKLGNLYALRNWDTNSLGAVPFGQGISVTPLQMVNALAVIANGGILRRPYITKEIRDAHGNIVQKNKPVNVRRVLRPEIASKMTEILVGVVEQGSGRRARIEGVRVAGKTGTAQKAEKGKGYIAGKEVMSFMGFLPADNPKIAIIVTLDEPTGARFSGQVAGPIFKRIATQSLKYIERTGFLDTVPRKRNNRRINSIVEKTNKTNKEKAIPKPSPLSDDTLVRNGEDL